MLNSKTLAKKLKKEAQARLANFGIEDRFVIKIRPASDSNWVAQYRAQTQFTNWHMGPIFWITEELLDNPNEFVLSVLHEYGHVIAEYAWARSPDLQELIKNNWKGQFLFRPWDEEDFAEEFAQYVGGNFVYSSSELKQVISLYTNLLNN